MSRRGFPRRLLEGSVPPRGQRLLPALSGLLLLICFPPFHLLLPPFIALVPLLVLLAELPAGADGRRTAWRAGYLAGLIYFGLLVYWLVVALVHYSALAIPAYALTVIVLAGFTGLFAVGLVYLLERTTAPLALAAALLWTAAEWVQGHLGDLSFPWLGLGTSLSGFPRVAGAADLVGTRGIGFWLVLVNGLIATAMLAHRRRRPFRAPALAAAVVAAIPIAYGFWRAETIETRPAGRVAVVQPNIPEDLKMDRLRARDSSMVALSNLTATIPPGDVDLVVWPEVALPVLLEHPGFGGYLADIQAMSARVGAPIVLGAYGFSEQPGGPIYLNSAFLVSAGGIAGPRYDKIHLVPFVERIPFLEPAWLEAITGDLQYFGALGQGRAASVMEVDDLRFGTMICYESIFAGLGRRYRRAGAEVLVNITNDAWYGREPWYARTSALWQHPAHMVMRAIETRTGVARAANTGISLFVDPLGHVYARTELFEPAVRIADVHTTSERTLFVRWGDWLAAAATAAAALLLVLARLRGRRDGGRNGG